MADDTPQGESAGGDLELTPQWGEVTGADEQPARQVPVRKKGDISEAMMPSAADAQYREDIAAQSKQVAKERKLGIVLLALVLIAFAGTTAWKILKVEISLTASTETLHKGEKVAVAVKVATSHDVEVGLQGIGEKKTVAPGESELAFEVPLADLKLGANPLKVEVRKGGDVIKEAEITAFHDFELKVDKTKLANKPHNVYLNFKMAEGWKARVNGEEFEPSAGGMASVPVSMAQIFGSLDRFETPQYKLDVPVKIVRGSGHEFVFLQKVDVMLPQARMELAVKQDALVVAGKKAVIAGRADPGATVKVDGKMAEVAEDGAFEASVKLPKNKGFKIKAKDLAGAMTEVRTAVEAGKGKVVKIVVKTEGKVPSTGELLVLRAKGKVAKKFAKLAAAKK